LRKKLRNSSKKRGICQKLCINAPLSSVSQENTPKSWDVKDFHFFLETQYLDADAEVKRLFGSGVVSKAEKNDTCH
jgi:hypothetical protein